MLSCKQINCSRASGHRNREAFPKTVAHPLHLPVHVHARHQRAACRAASEGSSQRGVVSEAEPGSSRQAQWDMLQEFSKKQFTGMAGSYTASKEKRDVLRQAIMAVYGTRGRSLDVPEDTVVPSDLLLIGIMASDVRMALRGFRDWCQAMGLEYVIPENRVPPGTQPLSEVTGSVYLKYNSISKACYMSVYKGTERGVLLQLGQERLLGHFPLGLWDEEQRNPPPPM